MVYEESENILDKLNDFLEVNEDSNDIYDPKNEVNSCSYSNAHVPANLINAIQNQSMKTMKHQLAIDTLKVCDENKTKAAKQLGITRYTLDRLLK